MCATACLCMGLKVVWHACICEHTLLLQYTDLLNARRCPAGLSPFGSRVHLSIISITLQFLQSFQLISKRSRKATEWLGLQVSNPVQAMYSCNNTQQD